MPLLLPLLLQAGLAGMSLRRDRGKGLLHQPGCSSLGCEVSPVAACPPAAQPRGAGVFPGRSGLSRPTLTPIALVFLQPA